MGAAVTEHFAAAISAGFGEGCSALFATPLANGIVLAQLLVLYRCSTTIRRTEVSTALAVLTIIVLCAACALAFAANLLLPATRDLDLLRWIVLIALMGTFAQFSSIALQRMQPLLALHMQGAAPLLALNCLVLMVLLGNKAIDTASLPIAIGHAAGASLSFAVLLVLFAAMRGRIEHANIPAALRGIPIALLTCVVLITAMSGFFNAGGGG